MEESHGTNEGEELDFEPSNVDASGAGDAPDSAVNEPPEETQKEVEAVMETAVEAEPAGTEDDRTPVFKLRCEQCEFLTFKNIDEWKNHFVGHWRLEGMKNTFKVTCFVESCSFSPKDHNVEDRLSKMGQHFLDAHSFQQAAFRKCDICNLEFMEERKYNSHMRKHDESFTCDLCHKKITGKLWYRKHIEKCCGDERPSWARKSVESKPGEDKEVLEIYGKEYDVHWGTCTNSFTKVSRIVARAWIEGKGWAGKGNTRDEARTNLIKYLKDHVRKTMEKGLYQLEDGELVPEPTLLETRGAGGGGGKVSCPECGTQFSKRANLELHMFMHRGQAAPTAKE